MALKYTKDALQAEEIVNDVFLKLWADADKITLEHNLKSYIYRSVINHSLNAIKKSKRTAENEKAFSKTIEEGAEWNPIEANELKLKIYRSIDQLPEQCQRIFKMSRFEGMKQQEIADELGISIKTVKNHITHAIKQVGKSLDFYFIGALLIKIYFLTH